MKKFKHIILRMIPFILMMILTVILIQTDTCFDNPKKPEPSDFMKKWKVTELLTVYYRAPIYCIPHFQLGRTIVIDQDKVTQSAASPPFDWSESEFQYTKAELVTLDRENPGLTYYYDSVNLLELVIDKEVNVLRLEQEDPGGREKVFIVLDEDKLVTRYMGGYYLLEPFEDKVSVDFDIGQLAGDWEIVRLDSYDEGYRGSVEDLEETRSLFDDEELGLGKFFDSDFTPLDWYGESVKIKKNEWICKNETKEIDSVSTEIVSLEQFEKENHIQDGLSLNTENVEVVWICQKDEKVPLVIRDDNSFFMHIGQGWFLVERQDTELQVDQDLRERGFTEERVSDIMENYSKKVYQEGGRIIYAKKNGNYYDVIVTNADGKIVTAVEGEAESLETWIDVIHMLGYDILTYY